MPRKSAAAEAVSPVVNLDRHRIVPPAGLSDPERALFVRLVNGVGPAHFIASDAPLLSAYCTAVIIERRAAESLMERGVIVGGETNPWHAVQLAQARLMASLAVRLRLTPHSRADSRAAGRSAEVGEVGSGVDWAAHFERQRGEK